MAKPNLKKQAEAFFKEHPNQHKIYMTSDGQGFFVQGDAQNHANQHKLDLETFFREGHAPEIDSSLEEDLRIAELDAKTKGEVLDRVIDAANIDAEEDFEIKAEDHQSVKVVGELREKVFSAQEAITEANDAKIEAETKQAEAETKLKEANEALSAEKTKTAELEKNTKVLEGQINDLSKQLNEANKKKTK